MIPQIFLAPMAGYTGVATREIAYEFGAQAAISEMVSAKGILFKNSKTAELLKLGDNEKGIFIQLFGSEPNIMAEAALKIEEILGVKLMGIDINMGCPAPKIVKNGEGCALMLDLKKAELILSSVRRAYKGLLSVKFRKGFDKNHINAVEFSKTAYDAGCNFLTVHGRTREQYYGGKADWEIIKEVKETVPIPVIANGDIFSAEDSKKIMEFTGCSKVMIGRGALGNPFIFDEINCLDKNLHFNKPETEQIIDLCLKHARLEIKYRGEKTAMLIMRTIAPKYIKGFKNSAKLRNKLVHINEYSELRDVLNDYLINNKTSKNSIIISRI